MRDNAKSGALTEVTIFYFYTHKTRYAVMQFVEENAGGFR